MSGPGARVEGKLARWSDNWKFPHTEIPVRKYRAVVVGYVAQRADDYGWRLQDPAHQRPLIELKLSRVHPAQAPS
ncbi:hypothetical protein [Streptomyces blattellae]|uniref:hypothetical protein n=1 Tax=Streptomyces blattellae TaxID=2569855 RepID=UPI0012B8C618|nr:hypothetical protein [Streptomyces blattellae]